MLNEEYTLGWSELSVLKKNNSILKNVKGMAISGKVTAILGPSGAGKSTLLDVLAQRNKVYTGKITLNGEEISQLSGFKYISAYVQQHDALIPTLSVREHIQYAALLHLSSNTPREEIEKRIDEVIDLLGLGNVQYNTIGNDIIRGISGGQRRRVSIACELITKPKILFLDEPTSGLDSEASFQIMNQLQLLAKNTGITIITTIHQPSSEVYNTFDSIYLLTKGKRIYNGSLENAVKYFERIENPVPQFFNPPDHYLKVINLDFNDVQESKLDEWVEIFEKEFEMVENGLYDVSLKLEHKHNNNVFYQTLILLKRNYKNASKNILLYWVRAIMYIAMAILMGTVWWDLGTNQIEFQDRMSALFFAVAFLCFMSVAAIPAMIEEKHVFDKEIANGSYSVLAYTIANMFVSLPFILFIAILFTIVAYPMIGLNSSTEAIVNFVLILFLSLYTIESIVSLLSVVFPIFVVGLTLASFLNGLAMAVQGFFVQKNNIPSFWTWAHYWSYQKYAFEALVVSDLKGLTFECDDCYCFLQTSECYMTGEQLIDYLGYGSVDVYEWVYVLIGQIIVYRFLLYIVLRYKTRV